MVAHGHNQQPYLIQLNWGDPLDPAHESHVDCLDITWPSGARQTLTSLPMHDSITILEAADHVTVLRVEPSSGPTSGNTDVTIRGLGFVPGAVVYFGAALALGPITVSADGTTIRCRTPQWQPAGTVDVKVVNPDTTLDTLEAGFTFATTTGSGGRPQPAHAGWSRGQLGPRQAGIDRRPEGVRLRRGWRHAGRSPSPGSIGRRRGLRDLR
jgi:hypothetical protein